MNEGFTRANFPETRWTLIQRATDKDQHSQQRAIEELCSTYWAPVYAFVRSKGRSPSDAEDLTQDFFSQILTREDFETTSSEKGKMRTFLLCSMQNFLRNDWRDRNRLKRGGEAQILPILDEAEGCYSAELTDGLTPEQIFEKQWALSLLEHVLKRLKTEYDEKGEGEVFQEIKIYIIPTEEQTPRKEVAKRLGTSESNINVWVHRLRKKYRELIRSEIAETLQGDASVDEELQHLFGALG